MKNENIVFSRFRAPNLSRLTKKYHLNRNGHVCKISQPNFSNGTAETIEIVKLSDIEGINDSLGSNECISTGSFDIPSCEIVTKDGLTDSLLRSGVRARTKEHMKQPDMGIVLLDHDPNPFMPDDLKCETPRELISKLQRAVPQFKFVAYSGTSSCSSGITITESQEPYLGGGGFHVYIACKGIDPKQLQRFLEVKCWIDDLGFMAFARNGAMLRRSIIDFSVLSAEHLIYEATPILGEGLSRKPRRWQHRGGTTFSRDLSLTQDEITQFDRRVAEARAKPGNIEKSEQLNSIYREGKIEELVKTIP